MQLPSRLFCGGRSQGETQGRPPSWECDVSWVISIDLLQGAHASGIPLSPGWRHLPLPGLQLFVLPIGLVFNWVSTWRLCSRISNGERWAPTWSVWTRPTLRLIINKSGKLNQAGRVNRRDQVGPVGFAKQAYPLAEARVAPLSHRSASRAEASSCQSPAWGGWPGLAQSNLVNRECGDGIPLISTSVNHCPLTAER